MINHGPQFLSDGFVEFHIWAPRLSALSIKLICDESETSHAMSLGEDGLFHVRVHAKEGDLYWAELPDGTLRPDPSSRFQPQGVHGPSQLINTSEFQWKTADWKGVQKKDLVLYEMHIGTYTKTGTYLSAIDRLPELVELGVTAIEIMPLSETAGARNWGYDGVNLFAPRNSYGTPHELKQFVDAAHALGLAVIHDVIYNHFGPEGNYLHDFGGYISTIHKSIWGDTPNYDGDNARFMRDYIVQNAIYWLEEFRFDGLRLDAIHCIEDDSAYHIVSEIGQSIDDFRSKANREICLIAESNVYDPEILTQLSEKGHGFDAAWCDDFLHSVFAVLKPGQHMSQRQYQPHSDLDIVLRRGFVFQGTLRQSRRRIALEPHSKPVQLESLIFAIQNHDFIGNHPQGLRLHRLANSDAHLAAAALLILHPSIPMLFMGEEFASPNPFLFFVDFGDEALRHAVEVGRPAEYPQHDWSGTKSPLDDSVFRDSYIGDVDSGDSGALHWYKDLIRIRKEWRKLGLLDSKQLTATWNEQEHIAHLTYQYGEYEGNIFIRIHPQKETSKTLQVTIPEHSEILLSRNCKKSLSDSNLLQLEPFAVCVMLSKSSQTDRQ